MSSQPESDYPDIRKPTSALHLLGSVEGWAALVLAIAYLCWPEFSKVRTIESVFWDMITRLFPAVVGAALAYGGVRHGNRAAKIAGSCAALIFLPLVIVTL